MSSTTSSTDSPPQRQGWADRGWYLAVEYGVLARDKFLKRLPQLRRLGSFKELLEPGGKILYRNIFRESEVPQAWDLLTLLTPWQEQLVCYLKGEDLPIKRVKDLLWCAGFLRQEDPCRGDKNQRTRPLGCEGARILVGAGQWDKQDEKERHVLTFATVDEEGMLRFDRDAIAEWVLQSETSRLCPASPARDPAALAAAFKDVSVRALGWPLVAELSPEVKKQIGKKALEAEHGFVLKKGQPELDAHAPLELRQTGGQKPELEVRPADPEGLRKLGVGKHVRVPAAVERVLAEGIRLRGVRIREDYVRLTGGHYEVEQRFVLSTRLRLDATDRVQTFKGYELSTTPAPSEAYLEWSEEVVAALPPAPAALRGD